MIFVKEVKHLLYNWFQLGETTSQAVENIHDAFELTTIKYLVRR